jgi:hypothetical protein
MKIEEAITILNRLELPLKTRQDKLQHRAVRLGIEALIRLKEHREQHIDITFRALPGETELPLKNCHPRESGDLGEP